MAEQNTRSGVGESQHGIETDPYNRDQKIVNGALTLGGIEAIDSATQQHPAVPSVTGMYAGGGAAGGKSAFSMPSYNFAAIDANLARRDGRGLNTNAYAGYNPGQGVGMARSAFGPQQEQSGYGGMGSIEYKPQWQVGPQQAAQPNAAISKLAQALGG